MYYGSLFHGVFNTDYISDADIFSCTYWTRTHEKKYGLFHYLVLENNASRSSQVRDLTVPNFLGR